MVTAVILATIQPSRRDGCIFFFKLELGYFTLFTTLSSADLECLYYQPTCAQKGMAGHLMQRITLVGTSFL